MHGFHQTIKKASLFAAAFLVLAGLGSAATINTQYTVNASGTDATVTALLDISSEQRVGQWELSWTKPVEGDILSITDESGDVEYSVDGRTVTFTTNRDTNLHEEQVRIRMHGDNVVDTRYAPLKELSMRISQLQTGDSTGTINVEVSVDEPLLSWRTGFDVQHDKESTETIKFSSTDPFNPKLYFSSGGRTTEHFAVFDQAGTGYAPTTAEQYYSVVPATTGFTPPIDTFPVVILSDNRYESDIDRWSSGQYHGGGLIILKESTVAPPEDKPCQSEASAAAATLLHEVAHGFNEYAMYWDRTQTSWFDEGTGKYVEYAVNSLQNVRQSEIFGEQITWTTKHDGERYKCSLDPRHTPEDLHNYYTNNQEFMPQWSPEDASVRSFGYAYAELYVRDVIREDGYDALHNTYDTFLNQDQQVDTVNGKTRIVTDAVGTPFTPCKSSSLSAVEQCTDQVNEMTVNFPEQGFTVKQIGGTDLGNVSTDLTEIELKEGVEGTVRDTLGNVTDGAGSGFAGFLRGFGAFILSAFDAFFSLF